MAPSTIAYSAYNALCAGGPSTAGELAARIVRLGGDVIPPHELERALVRLERIGLVAQAGGTWEAKDKLRRVVVNRNRAGEGWDSWLVKDPVRGVAMLTDENGRLVQGVLS